MKATHLAMGGAKGLNTRSKNTFRFQKLEERTQGIKVRESHRVRSEYELGAAPQEGDSSCFLLDVLDEFRELDTSKDFKYLSFELSPLVQSMAMLLYNVDAVVGLLVKHLRIPGTLCVKALLTLTSTLARDLRDEFYPHFRPVAAALALHIDAREPEKAGEVFRTLNLLFKYLSKPLLADMDTVRSLYGPLLGHRSGHMRGFAAESLAFLLRKLPPKALRIHVRQLLRSVSAAHHKAAANTVALSVDDDAATRPVRWGVHALDADPAGGDASSSVAAAAAAAGAGGDVAPVATLTSAAKGLTNLRNGVERVLFEITKNVTNMFHSKMPSVLGACLDVLTPKAPKKAAAEGKGTKSAKSAKGKKGGKSEEKRGSGVAGGEEGENNDIDNDGPDVVLEMVVEVLRMMLDYSRAEHCGAVWAAVFECERATRSKVCTIWGAAAESAVAEEEDGGGAAATATATVRRGVIGWARMFRLLESMVIFRNGKRLSDEAAATLVEALQFAVGGDTSGDGSGDGSGSVAGVVGGAVGAVVPIRCAPLDLAPACLSTIGALYQYRGACAFIADPAEQLATLVNLICSPAPTQGGVVPTSLKKSGAADAGVAVGVTSGALQGWWSLDAAANTALAPKVVEFVQRLASNTDRNFDFGPREFALSVLSSGVDFCERLCASADSEAETEGTAARFSAAATGGGGVGAEAGAEQGSQGGGCGDAECDGCAGDGSMWISRDVQKGERRGGLLRETGEPDFHSTGSA
jgi:hypothetical protein